MTRQTIFSPCRKYRYTLWRQWADDLFHNKTKDGHVMFIGLNPSTADETLDDPTIRKCMGFTKRWGYLEMCMTNLFAFRATEPKDMIAHSDPVGDDNNDSLANIARDAALIIAAWGTRGCHLGRDEWVSKTLLPICLKNRTFKCLRKTIAGHPEHPLYVPYDISLQDWP